MTFRASVLTLYPEMFPGPLGVSLAGRALDERIWALDATNIRDFATDKHRSVDDTPAGGGAGMVLRPDVLAAALDSVADGRPMLALTPRGAPFTQARVRELAAGDGVILLCGRFEGFDERVFDARRSNPYRSATMCCRGGEVAAMVILDACVRLLPGVMGAASSGEEESFETGFSNIRTIPGLSHGRAHDPRSAAVGGSCEDRGMATRTRVEIHGYGGRT